jgi:hypothetical protein
MLGRKVKPKEPSTGKGLNYGSRDEDKSPGAAMFHDDTSHNRPNDNHEINAAVSHDYSNMAPFIRNQLKYGKHGHF